MKILIKYKSNKMLFSTQISIVGITTMQKCVPRNKKLTLKNTESLLLNFFLMYLLISIITLGSCFTFRRHILTVGYDIIFFYIAHRMYLQLPYKL